MPACSGRNSRRVPWLLLICTLRRGPPFAGSRPPLQRRSYICRLQNFSSQRQESVELLGGSGCLIYQEGQWSDCYTDRASWVRAASPQAERIIVPLPVSEWAKTRILQSASRTQRRPRDKGSDGSSARHDVYHEDVHKEGSGSNSKWKSDDSGGAVDWSEGVWWELKR